MKRKKFVKFVKFARRVIAMIAVVSHVNEVIVVVSHANEVVKDLVENGHTEEDAPAPEVEVDLEGVIVAIQEVVQTHEEDAVWKDPS